MLLLPSFNNLHRYLLKKKSCLENNHPHDIDINDSFAACVSKELCFCHGCPIRKVEGYAPVQDPRDGLGIAQLVNMCSQLLHATLEVVFGNWAPSRHDAAGLISSG